MVLPASKFDKRTKHGKRVSAEAANVAMSVAHLNDTIKYNLAHVITHAKLIPKANNQADATNNAKHVLHHAADTLKAAKKMDKKSKLINKVAKHSNDLDKLIH